MTSAHFPLDQTARQLKIPGAAIISPSFSSTIFFTHTWLLGKISHLALGGTVIVYNQTRSITFIKAEKEQTVALAPCLPLPSLPGPRTLTSENETKAAAFLVEGDVHGLGNDPWVVLGGWGEGENSLESFSHISKLGDLPRACSRRAG